MDELIEIQGMDNNGRFFDNQNNLIWSPNDISALPSYMPAIPHTGMKLDTIDNHQLALEAQFQAMRSEMNMMKDQIYQLQDALNKYLKYERRKLDK